MSYQWDEAKRIETLETRGIDFRDIYYFDWATAQHSRSDRGGEVRWASLGMIDNRLYHVVWTERAGSTRIISMRKANSRENREYDRQKN